MATLAVSVGSALACMNPSPVNGQGLPLQNDATLTTALQQISQRFVEQDVAEERLYFRTADELSSFWKRFDASRPPEVDFGRFDVILLLMGTKPSGGYLIRILSATEDKDAIKIEALHCEPPKGSNVIGVVTSPFDVKLVAKNHRSVTFSRLDGRTGEGRCR